MYVVATVKTSQDELPVSSDIANGGALDPRTYHDLDLDPRTYHDLRVFRNDTGLGGGRGTRSYFLFQS